MGQHSTLGSGLSQARDDHLPRIRLADEVSDDALDNFVRAASCDLALNLGLIDTHRICSLQSMKSASLEEGGLPQGYVSDIRKYASLMSRLL